MMKKILSFFSLFASLSTLLCCALPIAFVSIGMGAAFASLTASFPQIIWLTERKESLFIVTAILLIASYMMMKRSENLTCPIDTRLDASQRKACQASKSIGKKMYWGTVVIYTIGLLFSYVIPFVAT